MADGGRDDGTRRNAMSLAQKIEALREKLGVETGSSWPFIIECGFRFMGLVPEPGAAAPVLVEQLVLEVTASSRGCCSRRSARRGRAVRRLESVGQPLPGYSMVGFLASSGQNPCHFS